MAGFSITDFATLPTDFSLLGDSAINISNGIDGSKVLRLTPAAQFKDGAMQYDKQIALKSFTCTIKFRFTGGSGGGADGIWLVFHNDPPITTVSYPSRMFSSKAPSVLFEVDTFYNSEHGDPNNSHIGINLDGVFTSEQTSVVSPVLNDGNLRTLLIEYANEHIDMSVDGSLLLQRDINMVSELGGTTAWMFLEGMTGAEIENHDIIEWSFEYETFQLANALMFSCNT